ncbi:YciI family protein [Kordia sp.]|uniref:YciI family protein n=1 Tax=Kordia sp. TaxID=1965332 RepID=UPI003D6B3E22
MNKYICLILIAIFSVSCNNSNGNHKQEIKHTHKETKKFSPAEIKKLTDKGYKIIEFIDPKTKDTILMQQYFMAFLKKGKNREQSKRTADSLQRLHLAHLKKMYDLGYADISGPFGDLGDIRGVTIYNVPTLEMADSLANSDPSVKAGRLEIELHPWWAGKGYPLR